MNPQIAAPLHLAVSLHSALVIFMVFFRSREKLILKFQDKIEYIQNSMGLVGLQKRCVIDQLGQGYRLTIVNAHELDESVVEACYQAFDEVFGLNFV